MKRGRVLPWRPHEDEYLRQNYATMPCQTIAFYLRRTKSGVWKRASRLKLSKPNGSRFQPGNEIGKLRRFAKGHTPATKGQRTKLRLWERAVNLFQDHTELTQSEMAQLLGVPSSSISGSLVQRPDGLIYIDRWRLDFRHYVAIYRAGQGTDAPKPNKRAHKAKPVIESPPQPVPQPTSWLWGLPIATDHNQAGVAG